jgi:surfactin synthase thioesterase subunit
MRRYGAHDPALPAVICFPPAGSGASAFASWAKREQRFNVIAVQPPGREERFDDPFLTSAAELAGLVFAALVDDGALASGYVFFGHSLGALVAYETTLRLLEIGSAPLHLLVAASPAPDAPLTRPPVRALGDDALVAALRDYGGLSDEVVREPELMEFLVPVIRADMTMFECYPRASVTALPVPVTALHGRDDRVVSAAEMRGWRRFTSADFTLVELGGGHFFPRAESGAVLAQLDRLFSSHDRLRTRSS